VCTPELASLHLAREKLDFLRQVNAHSKVSIILNRVIKKPLFITQQVEEFLNVPVSQMFANDYEGVNRAVMAGTTIAATSELGKQFSQFAARLDSPGLLSTASNSVSKEIAGKETISWGAGQWQLENA
jgi:Flp pilus assembly CpaE family ATPase